MCIENRDFYTCRPVCAQKSRVLHTGRGGRPAGNVPSELPSRWEGQLIRVFRLSGASSKRKVGGVLKGNHVADITKARKGQLIRTLFDILLEHPDGLHASDALAALAERVGWTDYEAGDFESGGRRFERIVRFNTIQSVKAGWLAKRTRSLDGHRRWNGCGQSFPRLAAVLRGGDAPLLEMA